MSTKDDQILEFLRFYGAQTEHESVRVRQQLLNEAAELITKLCAERNAAARDMRERCKAIATERLTGLEKLRDDLLTPEAKGNVQYSMDQVLIVLGAIAALPDAVIATDGGTNG